MDEGVLHVVSGFRAGLKEAHAELARKGRPLLGGNHFFIKLVGFVSDKDLLNVLTGVQLNLADPVPHVVEALLHRAVVGQDDTHCALIVGLRYRAEPLLAGRVPDL